MLGFDIVCCTRDYDDLIFDLVKIVVGDCKGCHINVGKQVVRRQRIVVFKSKVSSNLPTTVIGKESVR
jgi:hypothetical protein